jgi:hypothetical protein
VSHHGVSLTVSPSLCLPSDVLVEQLREHAHLAELQLLHAQSQMSALAAADAEKARRVEHQEEMVRESTAPRGCGLVPERRSEPLSPQRCSRTPSIQISSAPRWASCARRWRRSEAGGSGRRSGTAG